MILWGNGTFVNPSHYDAYLRHFASMGFIVAAANTTNAGSGHEMLAGLDNLTRFNSDPASPFYNKVDLTRVGATGHSQGGGGSIQAGADPRVDTVVLQEPGGGTDANLHGTAFYMSGAADTTVPPAYVKSKYDSVTHPRRLRRPGRRHPRLAAGQRQRVPRPGDRLVPLAAHGRHQGPRPVHRPVRLLLVEPALPPTRPTRGSTPWADDRGTAQASAGWQRTT